MFNLPAGASISRFAMYVTPTQLMEGELVERERGAQVYQTIVNQRRDPAIFEQIGENLFKIRVFPIPAEDSKRILLSYTLPLESEAGRFSFRLPLLSDLKPIWDFRLSGVIEGPTLAGTAASTSHPELAVRPEGAGRMKFELRQQQYQPKSDFCLHFSQTPAKEATLRSYVAPPLPREEKKAEKKEPSKDAKPAKPVDEASGPATYFLASLPPDPGPAPKPGPADVLVLAETSTAMLGCAAVRETVRTVVANLRPEDRFRLMCADVAARALHDGWLGPADAQAAAVPGRFDREFCLGATDPPAVFAQALATFGPHGTRRRLVIYVGQGGHSSLTDDGPQPEVQALLEKAGAELIFVQVGKGSPAVELALVVRATGGLWFQAAEARAMQRRLFLWVLAGMPGARKVAKVEVDGAAKEDLFYPSAWPADESLQILGRTTRTDRVRLRVELAVPGRPPVTHRQELPVQRQRDDLYLGRLWAQRKLEQLRSLGSLAAAPNQDVGRQSIALAQEWSLLTPHTAFLVLETEEDYARWNIDRRQRRRCWKPEEAMANAPLPESWLALAAPPVRPKPLEGHWWLDMLRPAREALQAGNTALADAVLQGLRSAPDVVRSAEYHQLREQVALAGAREKSMQALGTHRALFDLGVRQNVDLRSPGLAQLFGTSPARDVPSRRSALFPHLLAEVEVRPMRAGQALSDLVERLRALLGTIVTIDREASEAQEVVVATGANDGGPDPFGPAAPAPAPAAKPNQPARREEGMGLLGRGRMSLLSYARFVLQQRDLAMIEEPHRLRITSREKAELHFVTEVYPVADLLVAGRLPSLESLDNPWLDRRMATEARLRAALKRPITTNLPEKTLPEVAVYFAKSLNGTVLLDLRAMQAAGVDLDKRVSGAWRDVPAKESLRWLLEQRDLDYVVRDEALLITTPEEYDQQLQIRLHPAGGLMYLTTVDPIQQAQGFGGMGFMGGMGGFGGGMGGMSFGGMMGGGMGGMGMGAFGATPDMGSSSPANAPSVVSGVPVVDGAPVSRLSSGGVAGETPARSEQAAPARGDDLAADPGPLAFPRPSVAPAPAQVQSASPTMPRQIQDLAPQYQVDADGIIHMVQNSIDPTIWDSVGGPGTVGAFPHTLDLVVCAPERTQEKIEALMDRLRRMPVPLPSRGGWGLPTVADLGARDAESLDFDGLIDLLTDHVAPPQWEKVGGAASVVHEASRAALVISATQEHHEAITDFLTLLRRSRYAMLRQDRPWERGARDVPLWGPLAEIERPAAPRLAKLPAAEAGELALLGVRRQPAQGRWSVEWGPAGSVQPISISLVRDERRQEMEIAGFPCRIEGDTLAIAYPELGLVELGPWGESMRQFVDLELPWMPHRTNEELARLFRVSRAPASARRAADGRQDPVVRLRLVPRALPQNAETWLEIGISTADGRLVAWEAHREGKLVSRLRWQPVGEGPDDAQVALESADGKTCAVWRPRPVEKRAERAIPELEAGWPGYVVLDRRAEEAAVDRRVRHSIVALQRLDWTEAVRHLDAAAQEHPVHPLLPLARAWCFEADRSMGRREELVEALRRAASQGRRGPVRFVAERHLAWLGPAERLAVLSSQPPQNRDAVDWSYLAQAEMDVGHEREAAQAVRAALAATRPDARPFEQVRLCVELLLQLGQRDEAAKVATDWAVPVLHVFRTAAPPRDVPSATARNAAQTGTLPMAVEQAALLGELLARFGGRQPAEKLLTEALACAALAPRDRRGLLLRLAEFQEGLPRWKTLLSAAETSRAGTVERQRAMHWLDKELTGAAQADAAAQLAGQTGDAELQWRLRVRQAELTTDAALAAELAWQAHSAGRLPEERLAWACETWNRAGQSQRTVRALERHLRQGRLLKEGMACALAAAYYKAGREQDARRAASGDQNWDDLPGIVPPQPPPVPPSPQRRRRAPSAPARGSAAARVVG